MTTDLFSLFTAPAKMVEAGLRIVNSTIGNGPADALNSAIDDLSSGLSSVFKAGLLTMNDVFTTVQSSLNSVMGQNGHQPPQGPPIDGPQEIDAAVSDFANRLARITRYTLWEASDVGMAFREALDAARISFRYVQVNDPRSLLFPLQLSLSLGSLLAQQGLRGLTAYDVVGAKSYPQFVADFFELFTDTPVYVGLEYRSLIAKYQRRLALTPGNDALRAELGHTQVKCGLYEEAVDNLLKAANNPAVRPDALHDAAVALHRVGRLEEAAKVGSESLRANKNNERARGWLWLTAHKMGSYPEFVPQSQRMELKVGFDRATVEFEDIAARIGLDKTSGGRGLAVFDYNNDGLLDVLIACAHGGCNLYRNNGDGTFTDVSVESGLDTAVNAFIVTVGDYNNDGYDDLFLTRLGFFPGEAQLYRNNGNGTFTDVTAQAGLKMWGPAFSASWVDYDLDGNLDLFVANNIGELFDRKIPNRLFHNNGDGTFIEVTRAAGLSTIWPTIGSAWGDYNDDGYPDLFLSNGAGQAQLYRNNGDGTFTDVSAKAGIVHSCFGSVCLWCDYDNDGLLDIVQFTWSDHENVLYTMRNGYGPPSGRPLRIYHNNGDGTFTMRGREIGLTGCWGTMSGNAGDFNNDGYLDLVLGNGSPRMDRLEPPILLESDGQKFRNITFAAGLPLSGKGHGSNMADLFGDGRLSVLVAAGGAYPGDLLTTRVFYPTRLPGNYLNVRLRGIRSNRSAIGARICLEAGGRKQYREISGGTNFGCLPFEQHFGLAGATKVDAIHVRWPSGLKQTFTGLPANDTVRFIEGQSAWERPYKR